MSTGEGGSSICLFNKRKLKMNQKKQVPLLISALRLIQFSLTDITIKNAHNRVTVRPWVVILIVCLHMLFRFSPLSFFLFSFLSACSISTVSTLIDNAMSSYYHMHD